MFTISRRILLVLGCGFAAATLVSAAAASPPLAPGLQTRYAFCSLANCTDGSFPNGGLVRDTAFNLYGTTQEGGAHFAASNAGTVFKLSLGNVETVLYSFSGGTDGGLPNGGLVRDRHGNLYGTTQRGGSAACNGGQGCGTIFEVSAGGSFSTLYTFSGGSDGSKPFAGLAIDRNGNLYGTTSAGGLTTNCPQGCGTLFEFTPGTGLSTRYSFTGVNDGSEPEGALILAGKGGFLYGTTSSGGANEQGTVFEFIPGTGLTTLHAFCSSPECADGGAPDSALVMDPEGDLYGTTTSNGSLGGGGVFELSATNSFTALHSFCSSSRGCTKPRFGASLNGSLVRGDEAGNLYGTAAEGGIVTGACANDGGCGVIFLVTTKGGEGVLYSFTGGTDGIQPAGGLLMDGSALFGVTQSGGANGGGTVFEFLKFIK